MSKLTPLEQARHLVSVYAPVVAEWISQGRQPRPLSPDEKRLALTDPEQFENLVQTLQRQQLTHISDEAKFATASEDVSRLEAEERLAQMEVLRAQRANLLAIRYESALEIDAALQDLDASLLQFQEVNAKISTLDRQLDEPDRNRASFGLLAMALKRTLQQQAPALWKASGLVAPFMRGQGSGRSLADMMKPEGYSFWNKAEPEGTETPEKDEFDD